MPVWVVHKCMLKLFCVTSVSPCGCRYVATALAEFSVQPEQHLAVAAGLSSFMAATAPTSVPATGQGSPGPLAGMMPLVMPSGLPSESPDGTPEVPLQPATDMQPSLPCNTWVGDGGDGCVSLCQLQQPHTMAITSFTPNCLDFLAQPLVPDSAFSHSQWACPAIQVLPAGLPAGHPKQPARAH